VSGAAQTGRWAAVVGGSREGRDVALDLLVAHWRSAGLVVAGFRPRDGDERDEHGKAVDLYLEDLESGTRVALARTDPTTPDLCSYRFAEGAFEAAARWCAPDGKDLVVVGGLGPLEAAGRGHTPLVRALVGAEHTALPVLAIRRDALAAIALALPDPVAALELPADAATISAFAREVEGAVRPGSR
jgi:nucleoside-triphosphatase THEP1